MHRDLNLVTYVNQFETRHAVTCLRVSDTLGDIVTVSTSPPNDSFPGMGHTTEQPASGWFDMKPLRFRSGRWKVGAVYVNRARNSN